MGLGMELEVDRMEQGGEEEVEEDMNLISYDTFFLTFVLGK
jgi:hypothetical protein